MYTDATSEKLNHSLRRCSCVPLCYAEFNQTNLKIIQFSIELSILQYKIQYIQNRLDTCARHTLTTGEDTGVGRCNFAPPQLSVPTVTPHSGGTPNPKCPTLTQLGYIDCLFIQIKRKRHI